MDPPRQDGPVSAAGAAFDVPTTAAAATLDAPPAGARPIAYLVKMFPRLSETFIVNELVELRRRGVDVRIASLMRPTGTTQSGEALDLAAQTWYLPDPVGEDGEPGGGGRQVFRDHLRVLRLRTGPYLRALALCARRSSPTAWKRFLQGGSFARACLEEGVVHIHAGFAHTPASVAFWTSRIAGIPFSFAAHAKDIWLSDDRSLRRKMQAARFVLTCTEANAKHLRSLGIGTPVVVVYHGSDLGRFRPQVAVHRASAAPAPAPPPPAGAIPGRSVAAAPSSKDAADSSSPRILAVGRLVPKKGFDDLVRAAGILRDRGVAFELVFVGDGPCRESLRRQSERLGLNGRVRFVGSLPPEALGGWYASARVLALPSAVLENGDRDGIPNVLVEAMAMGLPVVSTRIWSIPELIRHEETGLLVDPRAPEPLAAALQRTLEDADSASRRAERARADVADRFDLHVNSAKVAALLERHSRPTRALYVCGDLGIPIRGHKGASAHARQIAAALQEAGLRVQIASPNPGPEPPEGNELAVALATLPRLRRVERAAGSAPSALRPWLREIARLAQNLPASIALGRLLRDVRPDFVLERYSLCAVATGILCRRRRIPWLLEVNAPLADEEARWRSLRMARLTRWIERGCLRRADHCFVVSHALRRWAIESGVDPDRVTVLPNGVDLGRFHPGVDGDGTRRALGFHEGDVVVAFAGSLKPWHGGRALLAAFTAARRLHPQLRLLYIGEGPELEPLRRRVRTEGLENAVRFTGARPQAEVPALLRAADILAAPYLDQEGFYFSPLKVMEYLAVGRPVVASRIGDIPGWVDASCGRLVAPGDVRDLATALEELARDPDLRGRLGRAAATRAQGQDWLARAEAILATAGGRVPDRPAAPRPPRVGYILKMFPRFSETFVVNEILEIERQGLDVRVFSMKAPAGPRQAAADRVRAPRTVLPRHLFAKGVAGAHLRCLRRDPRAYRRALLFALGRRDHRALDKFVQAGVVADACAREGIGHLHAHFASGPARVAKLASMISGVPFSFTAHAKDLYWTGHRHADSHKLKKRVKLARFVAAISHENARFLHDLGFRVKDGRIRVIHIGLRMEEFAFRLPSERPCGPRPLILGVGRLIEKKGFPVLLEALAILRARGVRFRCLLAGEGPDAGALSARIEALGLRGSVRLLGSVPFERLRRRYYSRARVLAQPCVVAGDGDRDGIPTVLLEAMALGVPVVSTRVSGIPEAIADGVDGFLLDPGDAAGLADRIGSLLGDGDLADRIAAAARARVQRQFSLEQNAGALRKLFLRSIHGWATTAELQEAGVLDAPGDGEILAGPHQGRDGRILAATPAAAPTTESDIAAAVPRAHPVPPASPSKGETGIPSMARAADGSPVAASPAAGNRA